MKVTGFAYICYDLNMTNSNKSSRNYTCAIVSIKVPPSRGSCCGCLLVFFPSKDVKDGLGTIIYSLPVISLDSPVSSLS